MMMRRLQLRPSRLVPSLFSRSSSGFQAARVYKSPSDLPASQSLLHSLESLNVRTLTPIQARSFDPIIRGKNFVGRAKTGTGKTLAYLMPLVERLKNERLGEQSALVLVPSRELCKQVGSVLVSLAPEVPLALLYGGCPVGPQARIVRSGVKILVSTPGRLSDLIERGAVDLEKVRIVVIDEADALLSSDFKNGIDLALKKVSKDAQKIMFSASMPSEVRALAATHMTERLVSVDLVEGELKKGKSGKGGAGGKAAVVTDGVSHGVMKIPGDRGLAMRLKALHYILLEHPRALIFTPNVKEAQAIVFHPDFEERKAKMVHAGMPQARRDWVINGFRTGDVPILVCPWGVLGRGVDFLDLPLVVLFRPPLKPSEYIHMAGRTGRAGSTGSVVTLYSKAEWPALEKVQELTNVFFDVRAFPTDEEVAQVKRDALVEQLTCLSVKTPFVEAAKKLLEKSDNLEKLVGGCIQILLHRELRSLESVVAPGVEAGAPPSVLSGAPGMTPVLLVDPCHSTLEDAKVVRGLVEKWVAKRDVGDVARSVSGYVVDVRNEKVEELLQAEIEDCQVLRVGKIPKLLAEPKAKRKGRGLPWRKMQAVAKKPSLAKKRQTVVLKRNDPRSMMDPAKQMSQGGE